MTIPDAEANFFQFNKSWQNYIELTSSSKNCLWRRS